ncbi:MAG: restriction endonuclease subunit S [Bacteroidetes bacterium]|nr:restriction endonuclease subunit S [Bacteroidota bacterium]MCL2302666.1 restriction endonuclease subunit S [Lentimicrobiaceae bacterium]
MNYNKTKIPKLRFPEFKEAGEWKEKTLGEISEIVRGGSPRPIEDYLTKSINGLNWLKIGDISSDSKYITQTQEKVIKDSLSKTREVNPGDLILSNSMSFGRAYILKIKSCIHDGWIAIRNISNITFEDYLYYFISSEACQKYFLINAAGAAVKNLNADIIKLLPIYLPQNKTEQQKIALTLSSLDDLITSQIQKLEALKTHKKGLMQQLFPAEGEMVPKLRFPKFSEVGEWEEKEVEKFFTVGSSKRILQEEWTNRGVPFYRTRELVSLSKNEPFGSEVFISEEIFSEISENYGIPTEGDFLVSGVGTLGVCYQVKNNDRFYFKDGNVLWFKLKEGLLSTYFKFCFQSDHIQNQILAQTSISTVGTYTIQNAKKTKFWLPSSLKEQQKIASCLSSLDDLISAQSQKVEALKKHKKGLMQQLFPNYVQYL